MICLENIYFYLTIFTQKTKLKKKKEKKIVNLQTFPLMAPSVTHFSSSAVPPPSPPPLQQTASSLVPKEEEK